MSRLALSEELDLDPGVVLVSATDGNLLETRLGRAGVSFFVFLAQHQAGHVVHAIGSARLVLQVGPCGRDI